MKKFVLVAFAIATITVVPFASAKSPAASPNSNATVQANPSSPTAGDSVTFSGCGYLKQGDHYVDIWVAIPDPNGNQVVFHDGFAHVDDQTCFTSSAWDAVPGSYLVTVDQQGTKNRHATMDLVVG